MIRNGGMQNANMAAEILTYQDRIASAEAAAQPNVVHLRTLHADPAVAREFALLRDDNRRLQTENAGLKSELEALQFKVGEVVRIHLSFASAHVQTAAPLSASETR